MKKVRITQTQKIVQHLLDGKSITHLEALALYGVGSGWGARMDEVRQELARRGDYILLSKKEKNKNGGWHLRWWLKGFEYDMTQRRLKNSSEWSNSKYLEENHIKMPE